MAEIDQLITAVPDFDRFSEYYSELAANNGSSGSNHDRTASSLREHLIEDRSSCSWSTVTMPTARTAQSQYANRPSPLAKRKTATASTPRSSNTRNKLATRREGGVITTAAVAMTSTPWHQPDQAGHGSQPSFSTTLRPTASVVRKLRKTSRSWPLRLTIRERLKQHATDQTCTSCHAKSTRWALPSNPLIRSDDGAKTYDKDLPDASETFREVEFTIIEFRTPSYKDRIPSCGDLGAFFPMLWEGIESQRQSRRGQNHPQGLEDKGFSSIVLEIARSLPFRYKTNQKQNHESGKP